PGDAADGGGAWRRPVGAGHCDCAGEAPVDAARFRAVAPDPEQRSASHFARGSSTAGTMMDRQPRIAILLPCYNEEAAIAATVAGFRAALPDALVYVYDNNSSDRTRELAAKAGAIVRTESQQGKGNVVRRMFADVDADI